VAVLRRRERLRNVRALLRSPNPRRLPLPSLPSSSEGAAPTICAVARTGDWSSRLKERGSDSLPTAPEKASPPPLNSVPATARAETIRQSPREAACFAPAAYAALTGGPPLQTSTGPTLAGECVARRRPGPGPATAMPPNELVRSCRERRLGRRPSTGLPGPVLPAAQPQRAWPLVLDLSFKNAPPGQAPLGKLDLSRTCLYVLISFPTLTDIRLAMSDDTTIPSSTRVSRRWSG